MLDTLRTAADSFSTIAVCLAGLLALSIASADLVGALGIRASYCYLLPVALGLAFRDKADVTSFTEFTIGLIVLGALFAPGPAWVDRGLAVAAILLVAALVRQHTLAREQAEAAKARHDELEESLRQAQKLESLGLLASSIAHDLNNILLPVTMLAPLLLEPSDIGDNSQSVQIIISSARRAKELVREMLLFGRKEQVTREAIRLDRLVTETRALLRAGIPSSIAIVEKLDAVPAISGSNGQLYQVVLNLATNAAEAIGTRSGTITIGTERSFDPQAQREAVRFYIADDGDGMDQETLDRAFDPFFSTKERTGERMGERATAPEVNRTGGTGIGLATVRGIVKSHGGSITARSALGKGTRFELLFPALRFEQAA